MSRPLLAVCVIAVTGIAATGKADAAVWRWACMGQTADQHVILNRDSLILLPTMQKVSALEKYLWRDSLEEDAQDEGASFDAQDFNSGLMKANKYRQNSENRENLVLTELSSRVTSKRSGRAGPRDEVTINFRKVYKLALEGRKPQTITMQCIEYTLSTKGGRG